MIVIRAFVGNTAYFLGLDNNYEPFMYPRIQLATSFDTREHADRVVQELQQHSLLKHHEYEIIGSPDPVDD